MAILINFSKMICGLFIDLSQVVMMTFVDGYKEAAAGNFATAFGLDDLLKFRWHDKPELEGKKSVGNLEIMGALLLALVLVIVAISVTLGTILIFLIRIIMIWFLVVLSPLAYLLSAFPGGDKYAQQWWTEFTKYLIVGPAMAFFLWLSLMVMSTADREKDTNACFVFNPTGEPKGVFQGAAESAGNIGGEGISAAVTKVSNSSHLLSYIIAIGMLCGSMMMAQQIGVAGAGMAMGVAKKVGGFGLKGLVRWPLMKPFRMASKFGKKLYAGEAWAGKMKGILLNPKLMFEKFREERKEKEEGWMRQGDFWAGKRGGEGGMKGMLLGMGGTNYYNNYVAAKGVLRWRNLHGMLKSGWTTAQTLKEIEEQEVPLKEDIYRNIKDPDDMIINKHLEKNGFNPKSLGVQGKNEKQKFINEWKIGKVKEYNNGPTKEEINESMKTGLTKKQAINKWKSEKINEMTGGEQVSPKFQNILSEFKKVGERKKTVEKYAPNTIKNKIEEKSFISKTIGDIEKFNIPQLEEFFEKALAKKDTLKIKASLSLLAEKEGLDDLIRNQGFKDNTDGYKEFMKQTTEKIGMNSQEAFEFQNDIGVIAGHTKQTRFDNTVKINRDGEYEERTAEEIGAIKYTKIRERGVRSTLQNDPDFFIKDKQTGELTNEGLLILQENFSAIENLLERAELDPVLIKAFSKNEKLLKNLFSKKIGKKKEDLVQKMLDSIKSNKESYENRAEEMANLKIISTTQPTTGGDGTTQQASTSAQSESKADSTSTQIGIESEIKTESLNKSIGEITKLLTNSKIDLSNLGSSIGLELDNVSKDLTVVMKKIGEGHEDLKEEIQALIENIKNRGNIKTFFNKDSLEKSNFFSSLKRIYKGIEDIKRGQKKET
jgi:hypothetical protein